MEDQIKGYYIHPAAIVETSRIGEGSRIWAFVHILKDVQIGRNVNICDHCFIEQGMRIGDNVTLKSGVYLWEGVVVEDDVFLGPNVVFTNDIRPRSKQYKEPVPTLIRRGASLGANSTVLAGVRIGMFAMSGMGSVITKDVPDYALVYGNPARVMGWVNEAGEKLKSAGKDRWISEEGIMYIKAKEGLTRQ